MPFVKQSVANYREFRFDRTTFVYKIVSEFAVLDVRARLREH